MYRLLWEGNMYFTKPSDTYKLKNGVEIMIIGFGTWQIQDGQPASNAIFDALDVGYRHIDTAYVYGNECGIGDGIQRSGLHRDEIFLTSKLDNQTRGYQETRDRLTESLTLLKTNYLDLYLIHWPNPIKFRDKWQASNAESWRAMEDMYKEGKIRAIGVSNFFQHHLEELEKTAKILPQVNQIQISPGIHQKDLVKYCRSNGIQIESYSPLGTGKVLMSTELQKIASKYGVGIPQLVIRWNLQQGYLPLIKTTSRDKMLQNLDVFKFMISNEDMEAISGITDVKLEQRNPDSISF